MIWKGLWLYARSCLGWTLLYLFHLLVITVYLRLLSPYRDVSLTAFDWCYLYLLSLLLYLLFFAISFMRWYPAFCEWQLRAQQDGVDYFVEERVQGTIEQRFYQSVLQKQAQLFFQEQQKQNEQHRLHLDFVNAWVHQMKTPLSTIFLELQQPPEEKEQMKEWLTSLEEEWERLDQGVDMVLSMARLGDFALDYQVKPLSLLKELQRLIQKRRKALIRHRIFPEFQVDEQLNWTILSDPKWHFFLLDQILQNAIKYVSQVRQQSRLWIQLQQTEHEITCRIRDEGPGIPPQDVKRVFAPFFTGENGRRFSHATGMGLYLVQQLCLALGHRVEIESDWGHGTTVLLTYQKVKRE
jgi:signal transduction histidine kinase